MGLTNFKGDHPTLQGAGIAKNYLTEEELKVLNNLVSGYFDFAEIQAIRHNPMYMKDYIQQLDSLLASMGEKKLVGSLAVCLTLRHYRKLGRSTKNTESRLSRQLKKITLKR